MKTVSQFITHASTQLNDQRPGRAFTRWGRGLLLEYLNLALAEIATYRPEAFSKEIDISLVAGAAQSIDPGNSLIAITANSDGTPVGEGDANMATAFNRYAVCSADALVMVEGTPTYLVRTFSIDKNNANKFYVDPPVPKGLTPTVKATIMGGATDYKLTDWDFDIFVAAKYKASIIDYMLACAYGLDRESPTSMARSERLYRRFYDVMGVKYRQESKFKSGYYLGKTGSGDPQAGAR